MLAYRVKDSTSKNLIYEYFVEGKEDAAHIGAVSIDLETGKSDVVKEAEEDFSRWYAFRLMRSLETMAATNDFKDSGTIMWY